MACHDAIINDFCSFFPTRFAWNYFILQWEIPDVESRDIFRLLEYKGAPKSLRFTMKDILFHTHTNFKGLKIIIFAISSFISSFFW